MVQNAIHTEQLNTIQTGYIRVRAHSLTNVHMIVVEEGVSFVPGGKGEGGISGTARARVRSALHDILPESLTPVEQNAYATHLEACAVALSGKDYKAYMTMMSRVIFNVKANGEYIIRNFPVSKVCRLNHKRLRTSTARAERDDATESRLQALLSEVETEAESASKTASSVQTDAKIRCPKCNTPDDITRVLAQLRRGDEGMTTRCVCKCGHTWKLTS